MLLLWYILLFFVNFNVASMFIFHVIRRSANEQLYSPQNGRGT